MSAPPKRPHEEGVVHSSSPSSGRPSLGGSGEGEEQNVFPRVSYGPVQENPRPGLLPRPEARDGERKSPLHPMYNRMPPPVSEGPQLGGSHPVGGPEVRAEPREVKENKVAESSRDVKVEPRDVHHQSGKVEKEGRVEGRVEESKEVKQEKEMRVDVKSDVKVEKDAHWKDQLRLKKHVDSPGSGAGNVGAWSGSQVRAKFEAPKEVGAGNVVKERVDANEAVGENRVDPKGDDKFKDRKRKEGKLHDWPETDKDRTDRSSMQVGSSSNNEHKEATKEEKESERWERERKDMVKEKERLKEREKDQVDRDGQHGVEKEGHRHEKEVPEKTSAQENFTSEQKKPKEPDAPRNADRDVKERRKERDGEVEGERPEKRSKYSDKDHDEGGAEAEGGTDREREAFSGVQQRKRMLRPRGSPIVVSRTKSRGQDGEG